MFEASKATAKPKCILKPQKVCALIARFDFLIGFSQSQSNPCLLHHHQVQSQPKKKKDEISVESLDYNCKILHSAWHPKENLIAVAATNRLFLFQEKNGNQ